MSHNNLCSNFTAQKMKFSIKDFFSNGKFLNGKLHFCAVFVKFYCTCRHTYLKSDTQLPKKLILFASMKALQN